MLRSARSLAIKAFNITILAAAASLGLVSCGGGGGGSVSGPTAASDQQTPTTPTNPGMPTGAGSPTTPSTPTDSGTPSNPATPSTPGAAQFTASTSSVEPVPAADASISGIVPLVVRGSAIANVELLPANGYEPKVAIFNVEPDKTKAYVNFDTTKLPNGLLTVRIVAFNGQSGQPASEIVAMETRTWQIQNEPAPRWVPIPPASLMSVVSVWEQDLPYVDPAPLDSLLQLSREALKERLITDWNGFLAIYHRYVPENVYLRPASPGHAAALQACFGNLITPDEREQYCRDRIAGLRNAMSNAPH